MENLKNILEWIALIVATEIGIYLLVRQIKLLVVTIKYIRVRIKYSEKKRKQKIKKEDDKNWNNSAKEFEEFLKKSNKDNEA